MYLKAISTAISALSTLSRVGRTLAANATATTDPTETAAPATTQSGLIDKLSLNFTPETLARDMANFADTLRQKLAARGVDLSEAPVLTMNDEGKIRVTSNHLDKNKIESVLADDRPLQQQFATISAQSSLLRAVEAPQVFAADYERAGNNTAAFDAVVARQRAYSQARFGLSIGATEHMPVFSVEMLA
jgi:hypothetical protein